MLWKYILRCGFATVMGEKAGSLFRIPRSQWNPAELSSLLDPLQLRCAPMQQSEQSVLLFLYNPSLIRSIVSMRENMQFLSQLGYPIDSAPVLTHLLKKMNLEVSFPHEIGLFLGYPLKDVQGYMANHGHNSLYDGYWKVYHDVEGAKRQFARFDMCKQRCLEICSMGELHNALIYCHRKCDTQTHDALPDRQER